LTVSDSPEQPLVKIRIDIADREGIAGESFWAESLGDDLYRLDNFPFHAYDLHYRDVVRAVSHEPDQTPTIVEVVQPSGHKTLRVLFDDELQDDDVKRLLDSLEARNVGYERSHGHFYALNVPPEADYPGVCNMLWSLENAGQLSYETGTIAPEPA
jgi:hypothetical protein